MKTIFYNSWIAKTFLPKSKKGIMLLGFVFMKPKENEVTEENKRHERVHQFQYLDCFLIALIPSIYLAITYSAWFLLISVLFYYAIYLLEYLISTFLRVFTKKKEMNGAYYTSALEMQAYDLESGKKYKHFGWFKYYGKI